MQFTLLICVMTLGGGLVLAPVIATAEPHILIGPTEDEEEPEIVETISGLSYDQLRRLRELRRWLDERQMLREQFRLRDPQQRQLGGPLADRSLLAPLGQRYTGTVTKPASEPLKLPPLPTFDGEMTSRAEPESLVREPADGEATEELPDTSADGRRVTHITLPSGSGAEAAPRIEYELHPER
jgi:hypothetical protein